MHPWPHRITFLAPTLRMVRAEEPLAPMAAHVLQQALFESLCRHPVVAMTDPDDVEIDDDGKLVDPAHPRFQQVAMKEIADGRRDEVLWFDVQLDPAAAPGVALTAYGADRRTEQWMGQGAKLSEQIESCLHQWLAARRLPASPRPLEPFTLAELAQTYQSLSRIVSAMKSAPTVAQALVAAQKNLVVPLLRLADAATSQSFDDKILAADPENPKSLLARAGTDVAAIRRVVALAPQWGKGHLALTADLVGAEALGHQAIAATLMPNSAAAVESYAEHLRRAGRHEEAYRLSRRCSRLVPRFVPAHNGLLDALRQLERPGENFIQAEARKRALADLWAPGRMPPQIDVPMRRFMLGVAEANCDVGRLDDAARTAAEALTGASLPDKEKRQARLEVWQRRPEALLRAYARDGHHRGELGRVLDGFQRGGIESALDAAHLMDALCAVGRDQVAACLFAQLSGTGLLSEHTAGQSARLAGARALVGTGELSRAFQEIQTVQLAWPQSKLESRVNRLLRVAAARPLAEWDRAVRDRWSAGARRLARLAARDCADFVPGAAESSAVREALGPPAGARFDRAWLEPLKQALGASVVQDIDLFFHNHQTPTLETADRLVQGWPQLVAQRSANDPTQAAQSLFLLGQALVRYLAATTEPPSPLAGGYRQVATDVMAMLSRAGVEWLDQSLVPFLAAIEAVAPAVDPWLLDTWLLRVERSLELDASRGGHVVRLSAGLRWVSAFLRGDERIAFELRFAQGLAQRPEAVAQARDLYERCVRADGAPETVGAWSSLWAGVSGGEALDALATAAAASPTHPRAHLALGKALLAAGKVDEGLQSVARGIAMTPAAARGQALAELRGDWRVDVPFDAKEATTKATGLMRSGKFEEAVRPARWAAAAEPGQATAKNLAIALARSGQAMAAVTAFATVDGSMKSAAQALHEAKRPDWAMQVYRAAAMLPGWSDEDWLTLGRAARLAGDEVVAADAYGHVYQARNGQIPPPDMAQFAQALANLGEWERCEEVARRLVGAAGSDQVLGAAAMNAMARSLLGRGRAAEAMSPAQAALQVPIPEVRKEYQATVDAVQRGQSPPIAARSGASAGMRALDAFARQDMDTAHRLATSEQSWGASRAAMTIAQFRGDTEAAVPLAGAARQYTEGMIQATAGQLDGDAVACRALALYNREQLMFPIDPVPPMAARLPRERLESLLGQRGR